MRKTVNEIFSERCWYLANTRAGSWLDGKDLKERRKKKSKNPSNILIGYIRIG
jgi:hypothetical protein